LTLESSPQRAATTQASIRKSAHLADLTSLNFDLTSLNFNVRVEAFTPRFSAPAIAEVAAYKDEPANRLKTSRGNILFFQGTKSGRG
jgi:hypothetical protein